MSVCIGIFICTRYSKLKKYDEIAPVATNQLTSIPIANPQTVQTMMVNGQLMQMVTPSNQTMYQTSSALTGSQPQMVIVQGANQQALQAVVQPVAQTAEPTSVVVGQSDSPPTYQVLKR